jgi:DNA polymerase-1
MPGKTFSEGHIVDCEAFTAKYGLQEPKQLIEFKALRGDASDNIPGVHGIGDVGATKLIVKYGTIENLYQHLAEVDEKTRNKLVESAEMAALSKRLATIDTNAPLTFDIEACETENYDRDKVISLFEQLEFKSLIKRIKGAKGNEVVEEKKPSRSSAKTASLFEGEVDEKEELKKYLKEQPEVIVNLDLEMLDVLERMKEKGILVDQDCLKVLSKDFAEKLEKLTKEIYTIVGHEFNVNSTKQLAEVLFDDMKLPVIKKTKTGRSTDEEVLTELALTQEIA